MAGSLRGKDLGIQFTPDWIPLDFQPFNQTFSLNGGTAYGRSGKGGLRGASFSECRTRLTKVDSNHCIARRILGSMDRFVVFTLVFGPRNANDDRPEHFPNDLLVPSPINNPSRNDHLIECRRAGFTFWFLLLGGPRCSRLIAKCSSSSTHLSSLKMSSHSDR